ncbi:MAG: T9SS type A sorting domain-containing protein [Saprospiraceae bacterium]
MNKFSYPLKNLWDNSLRTALFMLLFLGVHLVSAQTDCTANAGTLDALDICILPDQTILKATHRGDTVVPQGFQVLYVLTKGSELVIQQVSPEPVFALPDSLNGLYTLHTLVYNPATLNLNSIVLGQTSGFQVNALLIQGGGSICAALDVKGAKARFGNCDDTCVAAAGKLRAASNACLQNGSATLSATVQTTAVVPTGYTRLYVLTSGNNLVIQQVSTTPSFQVNSTGRFTIHTLVYDSTTLDLDTVVLGQTSATLVNNLLIQGGGSICGALDVAGAVFNVANCPPVCDARAGTLRADSNNCLLNGRARITAKAATNPTVPQGYQVRYLLVSGYGWVIQQINTTPSFEVTDAGFYTIHTLVYDPNTFNLNSIQLNQTQISQINARLIQGGGSICGSVDITGVTFNVKRCPPPPCNVNAGKLKQDSEPCLLNGVALLKAKFVQQPTVPNGFKILYLLSSGHELKIEQTNSTPDFAVRRSGIFTIHTLVYNPNTFNLHQIYLGSTTIFEIQEMIDESEGYLCAAVDAKGADFYVLPCVVCSAKAGKIAPANDPCLLNDTATIKAQITQSPTIPTGYAVRYLLTSGSGLVIRQINTTPSFLVKLEGYYTIHTLVYDSTTLNLNNIKLNITTAHNVHKWLIQGGGTICGALDLDGADFDIEKCDYYYCPVGAGSLFTFQRNLCLNPTARLVATHLQQPTLASGYRVLYLLTFGPHLTIEQTSESSNFQVNKNGTFRIHTLVYNPATLNLNTAIQLGTTRIPNLHDLLIQGGGNTCAALDIHGTIFQVSNNCNNFNASGDANLYPNPTTNVINVEFNKPENVRNIRVELLDVTGDVIKIWNFAGETERTTLDLNDLNAGIYNTRIIYDNNIIQNLRVVKTTH